MEKGVERTLYAARGTLPTREKPQGAFGSELAIGWIETIINDSCHDERSRNRRPFYQHPYVVNRQVGDITTRSAQRGSKSHDDTVNDPEHYPDNSSYYGPFLCVIGRRASLIVLPRCPKRVDIGSPHYGIDARGQAAKDCGKNGPNQV